MEEDLRKKWRIRTFLLFIPLVCLTLFVSYLSFYISFNAKIKTKLAQEVIVVDFQRNILVRELKNAVLDIESLTSAKSIEAIQKSSHQNSPLYVNAIAKDFLQFAQINERFGHIRFLGVDGTERVRIVKTSSGFISVPKEHLKNKMSSHFFVEAKKLKFKQIYISDLDYDIDHYQAKAPLFSGVIRFSTPVFSHSGKFLGVIELDLMSEKILELLHYFSSYNATEAYLIDQSGTWLKSKNLGDISQFIIPNKEEVAPKGRFSKIWSRIENNDRSQFLSNYGIFTLNSISVDDLLSEFGTLSIHTSASAPYIWKIVSFTPLSSYYRDRLIWSALTTLILIFIYSGYFYFIRKFAIVSIRKKIADHEVIERSKELSKANHELLLLNDQINRFVGIVAHDLRNPLGAIVGFSDILNKKVSPELQKHTKMINSIANASLELVADILQLSAIKTGKITATLETCEIAPIIYQLLSEHQYLYTAKEITITNSISEGTVFADRKLIGQVIANLLSNAIKFSAIGGKIDLNYQIIGGKAQISVRDYGVGINDAQLQKIRSGTSHLSTVGTIGERGTGFGIPFCREVLLTHNSDLQVESIAGQGSVFSFFLEIDSNRSAA